MVSADRMFKAFADETRLRILRLLTRRKELCVCEIVEILAVGQSKVSRHLAHLRNAGLVSGRREGLWKRYRLTPPGARFHKNLIACLGGCFGEMTALKRDADRLARVAGRGKACR